MKLIVGASRTTRNVSSGNVGHSRRSTAGVPQRPAIPSSTPLVTDHDAKARPGRRPPTQWNNRCIIPRLYQATFASSPLFPDLDSTPNPKIYRSAATARSRSRCCRGAPRCKVGSVRWNVEKRGGGATRDADRWPPHDPPHSKLTAVSRAGATWDRESDVFTLPWRDCEIVHW